MEGSEYSEAELARSLDMNPAEIARSLKRLEAGILYSPHEPHIMRHGAFELLGASPRRRGLGRGDDTRWIRSLALGAKS